MHEALFTLMRLRAWATVRGLLRGARRPRGLLYLLIGGGVLGTWLCGAGFATIVDLGRQTAAPPPWMPIAIPLFLLAYTVVSLVQYHSGMLTFTPAEIDFLFSGPFTRRELLLYKLTGRLVGCLASGAFFCIAFGRYAPSLLGLYVGAVLTLLFIQLVRVAAALVGLTLTDGMQRWGRIAVLGLVAALAAAAVLTAPPLPSSVEEIRGWWEAASTSIAGRVLLAPFQVFAQALVPTAGYPAGLWWLGGAALIDAALLGCVLLLDANYLESSLAVSQKRYEAIQRAMQGRRTAKIRPPKRLGRLPMLGWWLGAGPTAWRQLTTALRTGTIVVILAPLAFGVLLLTGTYNPEFALGFAGVASAYLTFILLASVRYDFRGDLDNIPWLKTLPVSPVALAAGQVACPVFVTSAVILAGGAGLWLAVDIARAEQLAVAAFVPVAVLLLYGVENFFFLVFPSRSLAMNPGELQSVGRFIVVFSLKSLAIGCAAGVAVACGGLAYLVSGQSLIAAGLVAWTALAILACATVPAVAWAFVRFDPGLDTPA